MNDILLVTLGCSWTLGVGVNYADKMSFDEFQKNAWNSEICNNFSFRSLICNHYKLDNINLSRGGSSNQKQFRLATEFFSTNINQVDLEKFYEIKNFYPFKLIKNKYRKIIVLWGITSTARYEIYDKKKADLVNDFYSTDNDLSKFLLENTYSHEFELETLSKNINLWNDYFELNNIQNIWFDTFNHHDYNYNLNNFLNHDTKPRDLLSLLTEKQTKTYHFSNWKYDDPRIIIGIKRKILNPHSCHPTKLGHQKIFELLSPEIEKLI